MKNSQRGFSTLLGLSLFIILLGTSLYLYSEKVSKEIPDINSVSTTTQKEKKEFLDEKVNNNVNQNITNQTQDTDEKVLFENEEYSFMYTPEYDCIKINGQYLYPEGKEYVWGCNGADISSVIFGTPDEVIMRLIYPGGPDSDGIWGKACFSDEKRTTHNGYTVSYFEDPNINELWGSPNCGTHPTKQANESVGNMNIYFIVSEKDNKYVRIDDVNNSTSTAEVWGIINSFKFK